MIRNDKEYEFTKKQIKQLQDTVKELKKVYPQPYSEFERAEIGGIESVIQELQDQCAVWEITKGTYDT
jgi:dihydroxyacid dehydratase/phosphogluconate dehydratase